MTHQNEEAGAATTALGALEARVMRLLWNLPDATVREALEKLNADGDRDLAYNTVMTVMARLEDKGFLVREREGRAYRYSAALDPDGLVERVVADDVRRLLAKYGRAAWRVMRCEADRAGFAEQAAD